MTFTGLEIKQIVCCRCGCQFALSGEHFLRRVNFGKDATIYCPNGHPNYFKTEVERGVQKNAIEEAANLRAELQAVRAEMTLAKESLVSLRHRAEQAEAKAAGAKYDPDDIPAIPDAADANPVEHIATDRPELMQDKWGRYMCPHCSKTYAAIDGHLFRHLRTHGTKSGGERKDVNAMKGGAK